MALLKDTKDIGEKTRKTEVTIQRHSLERPRHALERCSPSLKDVLCLSETRYPTFQRRDIFASLASLRLWKDAKDAQRRTGRFPDGGSIY